MTYARLTSKGQVTVPKEVREQLRLKPGDVESRLTEVERRLNLPSGSKN